MYNRAVGRPAAQPGNNPQSGRPPGLDVTDLTTLHDEELLALVARGGEAALGVLYDRHIRAIYTVALRIIGDRQTAEEVVQDVFQSVWQTAASFQVGRGSPVAWLLSIARHRSIDATRSKRERARSREQTLDPSWALSEESHTEHEVVRRALRDEVRAALGTLPTQQRQAIELAYYGGLSGAEIAARLGEPLGTVKTRLRLGMLKLRDLLEARHTDLD